ncbi:hypothetical protein L6452_06983, partial [Arctium lappa]
DVSTQCRSFLHHPSFSRYYSSTTSAITITTTRNHSTTTNKFLHRRHCFFRSVGIFTLTVSTKFRRLTSTPRLIPSPSNSIGLPPERLHRQICLCLRHSMYLRLRLHRRRHRRLISWDRHRHRLWMV